MLKRNGSDCNEKLSDVKKKKVKEELCDDEQRSSQLSPENGSSGFTPSSQATSQSPSNQHSSQLSTENCSSGSTLSSQAISQSPSKPHSSQLSPENGSSGSTPSSQATSQSPSTGDYKMKNGTSSQSSVKPPEEDQFIHAFAKSSPSVKITDYSFNYHTKVTDKYDKFWKELFASPNHTTGNIIKLVRQTLSDEALEHIAVILKRGWQEERYFPKHLAQPLLEACIFNRENAMDLDLKANMFYQYIKPSDLEIIKSKGKKEVDEDSLKVFKSYLSKNDQNPFNIYLSKNVKISVGEETESACKKFLCKIMYDDVCNIRSKWTKQLVGLLEFDKFIFLQQEQRDISEYEEKDVGTVAPHRLWSTFFYRWNDQIKDFYFKLLKNDIFKECNICGEQKNYVGAKHIVSHEEQQLSQQQKDLHLRMEKERHHNVMNIVVEKLISTKEYSDWNLVVLKQNYREQHWPSELSMLEDVNLYPNIVLYSTSPEKRALIVEVTICWDHWATHGSIKHDKTKKYKEIVTVLQSSGFKAEFKDVMIGARGIWSKTLYKLFDEVCKMKRSEITETMEKISKIIIEVAYNFHYKYKDSEKI